MEKERLVPGNMVRIRVSREARELGYSPCPDNTVAIFNRHVEKNRREFAELVLESGARLSINYDHLVEIVRLDYDYRRGEVLDKAIIEVTTSANG